jgi:hypothetical protein
VTTGDHRWLKKLPDRAPPRGLLNRSGESHGDWSAAARPSREKSRLSHFSEWDWKNTMKNKGIAIPKKDRHEIYRFWIWLFDLFGGCFNIVMGTVSVPNDLCMEFSRSFTPKITQKWNSIHGVYKYGYSSGKNHHSSSDHTHVCCMHMLTIVVHSTQC